MHDVTLFFTPIRMSAELGFPDRVYGLGAGIFFLTDVLFEIPGVILVERWSIRKWIAPIMVTWGLVTKIRAAKASPQTWRELPAYL
jgi:ACS family tartrate transporter-like MFS transporter